MGGGGGGRKKKKRRVRSKNAASQHVEPVGGKEAQTFPGWQYRLLWDCCDWDPKKTEGSLVAVNLLQVSGSLTAH